MIKWFDKLNMDKINIIYIILNKEFIGNQDELKNPLLFKNE